MVKARSRLFPGIWFLVGIQKDLISILNDEWTNEWMAKGYRKTSPAYALSFSQGFKEWGGRTHNISLLRSPGEPNSLHTCALFLLCRAQREQSVHDKHCFTLRLSSLPNAGQWRLYISALKNKVSKSIDPKRPRFLLQELKISFVSCFNKKVPRKGPKPNVCEHLWPLGAACSLR